MSFSIFIILFLSSISRSLSLEYKCHKDICDTSWQFCNEDEQKCEACGQFECSGENNFVKFDQCQEACKRYQSTTSTQTTPNPEKKQFTKGKPIELVVILATLCFLITICIISGIIFVIIVYRKLNTIQMYVERNNKCNPNDEVKQPLLNGDIEMGNLNHRGPRNLYMNCTEDNEEHVKPTVSPSAPPSYESNGSHPTTPSEPHPAEADLLADDQRYQATMEAKKSDEVTPKYVE